MRLNIFKKLFSRKTNNENIISEEINNIPNISIISTDDYIKMEIQQDSTFREYCSEIDKLSQDGVDEINQLPMRLLISKGMETINGQTVYLIKTNGFSYTISVNSNNIYLSSRKTEGEEIKEATLKIALKSKRYQIAKYVHDLNRSTKSVKTYDPNEVGNQFSMTTDEARTTVDLIIEQLEQIGFISEIVDISQIKECLTISKVQELNRANNVQNVSKDR
jgi:hypothetical protein